MFKILNINPIVLPTRSPNLNPIEDLWRMIKDKIYKTYYNNLVDLINIYEEEFNEIMVQESLYENWLENIV